MNVRQFLKAPCLWRWQTRVPSARYFMSRALLQGYRKASPVFEVSMLRSLRRSARINTIVGWYGFFPSFERGSRVVTCRLTGEVNSELSVAVEEEGHKAP